MSNAVTIVTDEDEIERVKSLPNDPGGGGPGRSLGDTALALMEGAIIRVETMRRYKSMRTAYSNAHSSTSTRGYRIRGRREGDGGWLWAEKNDDRPMVDLDAVQRRLAVGRRTSEREEWLNDDRPMVERYGTSEHEEWLIAMERADDA